MIRIEINFFVLILFSCSIVQLNCQICHGMSQYDQCSTNIACQCLFTADSTGIAICDFISVFCSELVACASPNNICYEPNHICVHHPRCSNQSVCYPLSIYNQQICPPITMTSTIDTATVITTTSRFRQNCSTSNLTTFDDITIEPLSLIPSDYINLQWENFSIMNLTAFPSYNSSGFYTALQNGYIAFDKNGLMMTISINPPNTFNLYSFIASTGDRNQLRLTMIGERQSKVLYSATYPLYTHWSQLVELNYLNIDKITFSTPGSAEFAMDNLCLSMSSP